jgi:hypothetical protein
MGRSCKQEIVLSEAERSQLGDRVRPRTATHGLVRRARLMVASADRVLSTEIRRGQPADPGRSAIGPGAFSSRAWPGYLPSARTAGALALAVARRIAASSSLSFGGVQAHAGHLQHIADLAERRHQDDVEYARAGEVVERVRADGLAPRMITGAGTGSHALDAAGGLFSEMQCGS